VSSDEEPDYFVGILERTNGAVGVGDAHRPERQRRVEWFEMEAGVRWIRLKTPLGCASQLLRLAR
jgi:hypothetical protein